MQELKINILTLRMRHHANASGYDQLINYLDADIITTNHNLTIIERALARTCRTIIKNSNSLWYHRANFITEVNAAWRWISKQKQIFHFLYGENSYRYLGKLKLFRPGNRIICTYHTPPTRFKELITDNKFISLLDAVVVVSTVQLELFAEMLGPERVHFVPHGIDTDYFQPDVSQKNHKILRCISVGSHLRDFQTLARVAKLLKSEEIQFIVVAPEKHRKVFDGMANIDFHSSINDKKLLQLYQSADILLLPLLDCTANNALLEGMSCGLPIVTTDLIGVKDYVDKNCSILAPKEDSNALADAVFSLYKDKDKLLKLGKSSRLHAMDFKWPVVAKKIQAIYADAIN